MAPGSPISYIEQYKPRLCWEEIGYLPFSGCSVQKSYASFLHSVYGYGVWDNEWLLLEHDATWNLWMHALEQSTLLADAALRRLRIPGYPRKSRRRARRSQTHLARSSGRRGVLDIHKLKSAMRSGLLTAQTKAGRSVLCAI